MLLGGEKLYKIILGWLMTKGRIATKATRSCTGAIAINIIWTGETGCAFGCLTNEKYLQLISTMSLQSIDLIGSISRFWKFVQFASNTLAHFIACIFWVRKLSFANEKLTNFWALRFFSQTGSAAGRTRTGYITQECPQTQNHSCWPELWQFLFARWSYRYVSNSKLQISFDLIFKLTGTFSFFIV